MDASRREIPKQRSKDVFQHRNQIKKKHTQQQNEKYGREDDVSLKALV
jgi:hypothetical protein